MINSLIEMLEFPYFDPMTISTILLNLRNKIFIADIMGRSYDVIPLVRNTVISRRPGVAFFADNISYNHTD